MDCVTEVSAAAEAWARYLTVLKSCLKAGYSVKYCLILCLQKGESGVPKLRNLHVS